VENPKQTELLNHYIESFRTGSLSAYRESQKIWVKDVSPSIDHILGFVESYRDPHGHRAEWEGVVCVADPDETKKMEAFVENAAKFSTLLPWATEENKGKGPFEKNLLDIPDFAIIHGLCYYLNAQLRLLTVDCSSCSLLSVRLGGIESSKCKYTAVVLQASLTTRIIVQRHPRRVWLQKHSYHEPNERKPQI
jgi:hypothetical protein